MGIDRLAWLNQIMSRSELFAITQALSDRLIYYKDIGIQQMPKAKGAAGVVARPKVPDSLKQIRETIGDCTRCPLHKGRTHIVFGEGNPKADLMFVGEGPGRDEDKTGRPFVGKAGQLLTKIIQAMKMKREDVYIANIVKCRPPDNRTPLPEEIATCEGFLYRQINVVGPKVIVCLGSVAAQNLLKTDAKISQLRGRFTEWQGIQVMPTYHPAFLLRNPNMKKAVWEDMKTVMRYLSQSKDTK